MTILTGRQGYGAKCEVGLLAVLAVCGATGPVVAETCVSASDMAAGVRAIFPDGGWIDYRPEGDDVLRIIEADATGAETVFLSRYGIFDLASALADRGVERPGSRIDIGFDGAAPLQRPAPGTDWTGVLTLHYADGGSQQANAAYVFGTAGNLTLGGCPFQTLPVKATFLTAGGWLWQEFIYFTDLGFGVMVATQSDDEDAAARLGPSGLTPLR